MRFLGILFAVLVLFVAVPSSAATKRVPDSALTMNITSRHTATVFVEVSNPTERAMRFDPIGLYFVPTDEDEPQRLGVFTAGELQTADGRWVAAPTIDVAPHASVKVKLTTYCIDHDRTAPGSATTYDLATRRMPTALATALAGIARTVTNLGYDPEIPRADRVAGAKQYDVVQAAIWRVRATMPAVLAGESHRVEKSSGEDED